LFTSFSLGSITILAQHTTIKKELYVVTDIANSQFSVKLLGKTLNTQSYYSYIGYGKKINILNNYTQAYITRGVIPFIEYNYPKRDNGDKKDLANGFGISPLGYKFFVPQNRWVFVFGIKSGIIYMNKTFPTDKGRRLNYSFHLSFGINKAIHNNSSLSLGYRFHHISNAQTGTQNPGIDSNFIFISIKQFFNVD
jgi:hypothetical protein